MTGIIRHKNHGMVDMMDKVWAESCPLFARFCSKNLENQFIPVVKANYEREFRALLIYVSYVHL